MPKSVRFAATAGPDATALPAKPLSPDPTTRPVEAKLPPSESGPSPLADATESAAWQQLFRHSPIGIGIYDRDGNCIRANGRLADLVGCEVSDLLTQNLHRLTSWQESGIYALALRAMASGGSASALIRGTSSFGQSLMMSIDFSVLPGNEAGYLILFARDLSDMRQLEDERREIQDRFEMLFLNSMDGILLGRPDGTLTAANPAACAMLGMTEQEVLALGRDRLLDSRDSRLNGVISARRLTGRTRGELGMVHADGSTFEVEVSSVLYPDRDGRMLSSSIVRDITQRRRLEQQLKDSLQLLDRLAQRAPGMLYQYRQFPDGRGLCPFVSEGIRSVFELEPEQVREDAAPLWARVHPDDLPAVRAAMDASARTLQPWRQEYRVVLPRQGVRWRLADAEPERMADGGTLWHGFVTDITQRRRQEEQTHWLAYFDPLTSLPNRRLFIDRISQALAMARRSGQKGSLMFIDLDHFKRINDARGHAIGDTLLRQVAQRLDQLVRAQDTVARLGGDEFVVLVCDLGTDSETATRAAVTVADKILAELRHPYMIEGTPYSSNGSIGITIFPKADETVDDLLREADTAMYRAKSAGRDRIGFYEAAMQTEIEESLALENDLAHAIDRGELHLVAQGQFDIDGRLAGAELLLRWDHPVRGAIPPTRFIALAEGSGLIVRIGEWVLSQCASSLARLTAAGSPLTLSINVSPLQFRHAHFVENVRAILAETGAPASQLIFEVTETLLITDPEFAAARMAELADLGIRFSLDDFGTGYASMAYLKTLRLYELKIDRIFVQGLPDDPNDTGIVKAVIAIAQAFHLRVVAEGVETPAQAEFLLNAGCQAVQGFLFARPSPFGGWVEDRLDLLSTAPR